jgi:hypothetical protein
LKFEFHPHYRPIPDNRDSLLTIDFTPLDGYKQPDSSLLPLALTSRAPILVASWLFPTAPQRPAAFWLFYFENWRQPALLSFLSTTPHQLVHSVAVPSPLLTSHIHTTALSSSSLHRSSLFDDLAKLGWAEAFPLCTSPICNILHSGRQLAPLSSLRRHCCRHIHTYTICS